MGNKLFCDCKTDEEKSNFFLSGRAVETGVIAPSISNDVAMAYHRCDLLKAELDALKRNNQYCPMCGSGTVPNVPDEESAYAMGAKGGPVVEAERIAFEAWMRGHCWALTATWDGTTYRGEAEHGNYICPRAMNIRQLWAAWRDRAALSAAPKPGEGNG